ncbi:MAG: bifunctional DNA-formamidopyrimidine glycosylase/DNA-(apurinic or apyrimidinic site) lyase [Armatimonadetes bacterium]|nr:bifunctional DNA-formamidopyrimidine glycosylase/DNA-(apurinic or apyrimidinic site) lyase [Armatimonadota bacterium]
MPELPEVETVVAGLRREAVGRRVVDVEILLDAHFLPSAAELADGLRGRRLTTARRWGKIWFVDTDDEQTLVGHLRMTGQLRVQPADEPRLPHTHLVATLDDGRELRWRDVRRFGWMHLLPSAEVAGLPELARLGPDALAIDEAAFVAAVRASGRGLKALLLGQEIVAGLGNIYVDEALHRARLHPTLTAGRLSRERARRLHGVMREVLSAAVAAHGSSIDGQYVAVDGELGSYQHAHRVYGRAGQPCLACGTPIVRIVAAGRGTHYCPSCQRRR